MKGKDIKLTQAQQRVLDAIRQLVKARGWPPTRQEIADTLGLYPNGVQEHLTVLHRKGYIVLTPGISRGIRIVEEAK